MKILCLSRNGLAGVAGHSHPRDYPLPMFRDVKRPARSGRRAPDGLPGSPRGLAMNTMDALTEGSGKKADANRRRASPHLGGRQSRAPVAGAAQAAPRGSHHPGGAAAGNGGGRGRSRRARAPFMGRRAQRRRAGRRAGASRSIRRHGKARPGSARIARRHQDMARAARNAGPALHLPPPFPAALAHRRPGRLALARSRARRGAGHDDLPVRDHAHRRAHCRAPSGTQAHDRPPRAASGHAGRGSVPGLRQAARARRSASSGAPTCRACRAPTAKR
jgi:hypothetical protein